jgi:LPXTG-site transpeptidase (sortase) family protein
MLLPSTMRKNRSIAACAAVLLVGAGLALLGFAVGARLLFASQHDDDLQRFREARQSAAEAPLDGPSSSPVPLQPASVAANAPIRSVGMSTSPPDQTLWSEQRIRAYREAVAADSPSSPPIEGVLRVPAVGIEVVVYRGTDNLTLERGAGRIEGTPPLGSHGNVGIAAHRDGFFRSLKDISKGDEVLIDLLEGTSRYEVTEMQIVRPEDVWVLDATTEPTLTLITCYPFYFVGSAPERFIVRARVTEPPAAAL